MNYYRRFIEGYSDIARISINAGDFVLLATKNFKLKRPKKSLWPKYIGPFRVLEPCGKLAYCLYLPPTWRIYNVVNISPVDGEAMTTHSYEGPVIILEDVEFDTAGIRSRMYPRA